MALFRVGALRHGALDAAAAFHSDVLPKVRESLGAQAEGFVLLFEPAAHEHRAWRLAMVQQLARDHAPHRVNAIESDNEVAIAAAHAYLAGAEGVTGQYMPLDSAGAGEVLD